MGWQQLIERWRLVAVLLLIAFVLVPGYKTIRRSVLLVRIERGFERRAWSRLSSDLLHLWKASENTPVPRWLEQAIFDFPRLNSIDVDTIAQAKVIQWLNDQGGQSIARLLLDQNTVVIPSGSFLMGSGSLDTDECPIRQVSLRSYAMDRFEITHLQYRAFIEEEGISPPVYWQGAAYPIGRDLQPVVGVSWEQADAYCRWSGGRLPTEAEWERACRGDDGGVYPWGDHWVESNANLGLSWSQHWPDRFDEAWRILSDHQSPGLQAIGSHPSGLSPFGLAHTVGNAAEWVRDWYDEEAYKQLPNQDPISTGPPYDHVIRGNGWFSRAGWQELVPQASRCAARSASHSYDDPRVGFRCAQDRNQE